MAEARLYSFAGASDPQTTSLDDRIFAANINEDLLYRVVRMQLGNRRQGTHSTKTRGEVRGGGRKPWRQKGTGRARAGSRRSPLWVGGGTIFGPKPRSYESKLTKKMKLGALAAALSDRAGSGNIALIDQIGFEAPRTKAAVELLNRVELSGKTLVVVATTEYNRAVKKSFTNLPKAKCIACGGVNVYDILRYDHLLMTTKAVEELTERF
ncbi:50S ribosomal protein L4 [Candidatus Bipolaricaulota bacterium]|nr:50S ribosomal protein L4 [Candidatus Bipolaricaulota bacterium]